MVSNSWGGTGSSSTETLDIGLFPPGTVFADRYRIVALLGRGGMGEVYRADDLKLEHPVALKFLPEDLARHPDRLARFHNEVRTARQVSHPNVCRVYDIGEVDDRHFLSMEYVDGEDLSSLLRRIGRLPKDKGIELARQLCAGLSAAHDRGILHRDLKPANIMIDGKGRVRITDFGLAGLAKDLTGDEVRAGTPAYMAPEQLDGKEATTKSDIYALGLVFYEIFTGKKAVTADSLPEIVRLQRETTPSSPSTIIDDIDPAVERAILRCIEKDPAERPATALAVSAALPGGDPLEAALAAGETPSPEMVAAADVEGKIRPTLGWLLFLVILVGLAGTAMLNPMTEILPRVGMQKSPEILQEQARQIIDDLGYTEPERDSAYGLTYHGTYLRHVAANDSTPNRWDQTDQGRPASILLWYRESPRNLVPRNPGGSVTFSDPPMLISGMTAVMIDTEGLLQAFIAVPPQVDYESTTDTSGMIPEPDWDVLFGLAGLDRSEFTPTDSMWTPPYYSDTRAAWAGHYPNRPDIPIRVEAAGYMGKPVYFHTVEPWTRPGRMAPQSTPSSIRAVQLINVALVLLLLLGGAFLALRNVKLGRGDRSGALRLAVFALIAMTIGWVLTAGHSPNPTEEFQLFTMAMGVFLFFSLFLWVMYLAIEPYVRRRWPHRIVSWSRLLGGHLRDPLVGRDILIGAAFGIAFLLIDHLEQLVPMWLNQPPSLPSGQSLSTLLGVGNLISEFLEAVFGAIVNALAFLFLPLMFMVVLRREWLAFGLLFIILAGFSLASFGGFQPAQLVLGAMFAALVILVVARFGLLTMAAAMVFSFIGRISPMTLDLTGWDAYVPILTFVPLLAIAAYAFYAALGGKPLFGGSVLHD
jgi:serine/threonine-protein kinase